MKEIRILLLATLFISLSQTACDKTYFTADSSSPASDISTKSNIDISRMNIRFVSENKYSLVDIMNSDKGIYGIGTGVLDPGNNLYFSRDIGKSWENASILPNLDKEPGFSRITENNGILWAVAGEWLVKNERAAPDWQAIYKFPTIDIVDLSFDGEFGFAIGKIATGAQIFKTRNGGKHWEKVYENLASGNPFDLIVIDRDVIIVTMNDEYVLRTEDSGKTWVPQQIEPREAVIDDNDWVKLDKTGAANLQISPDRNCWIVGEKGSIYFSNDRGKTWNRPYNLPESLSRQSLNAIAFSAKGRGVAVGENGYIIISNDLGKSWNEITGDQFNKRLIKSSEIKRPDALEKVIFIGENALILGKEGIYELTFSAASDG